MKHRLQRIFRMAPLLALLALAMPVLAEDIDIFAGIQSQNDLPNVLIIWDSSSNWGANMAGDNCSYADGTGGPKPNAPDKEQGTKFAIEKCAIYNVIYALPVNSDGTANFNIGLMLFNESNAPQGGYPRKQFVPLTAANKATLLNTIRNITINADKANNAPYAQVMQEAYLMFARAVPYRGTLGVKWDAGAVVSGHYVGPPGTGCGKNHIIWVSNGSPNENNTDARGVLQADGGDTTQIVYPTAAPTGITNSDQADWADEFARWMAGVDVSPMDGQQGITTHAVAVIGGASDGLYPNYIHAIATQGGGQYYAASSVTQLVQALLNILNSVQTANSVFASTSLPVSVSAQGTFHNQVFVGLFRPDELARPRWYGNLKQYKITYDPTTDSLSLADREGNLALNSATGFFNPNAISYWTEQSQFWMNNKKGTPPSASDEPDGEVVEKGGAAQRLRIDYATSQSTRRVYTCITCPIGTTLTVAAEERFETANTAITQAMLGVDTATARDTLINWVRGNDNRGDEKGPNDGTTTVRPSIHGDILHSRPAVLDYGGSVGTIVFYGGNDGMLHAVNANQTGTGAGSELWAFVPSEFFGRLNRLRDNLPEIRYPTTPPGANATPRDYFVDGTITAYRKFTSSGDLERVMIFVSMRRGGRLLYAFDVTTPSEPQFLWRKSSADIPGLGQTWSEPRLVKVRGNANPVLVFGAGYDATAEDALPAGAVTMGNAVLIVDALTGELVRSLPTDRSVPAAVAVIDVDFDNYADRLYAVDAGANVYRVDVESNTGATSPASWTITKIAALNDSSSSRKFLYKPDVVQTGAFTAIFVGSGNRERPLLTSSSDRFYTLFDYKVTKGAPSAPLITNASLVPQGTDVSLGTSAGCYLNLETRGEKVVTSAVSIGGYTYFSTNRPTPPSPTSCTNLGIAKGYALPMFCGTPASLEFPGGGLPPSPVIGEVDVIVPPGPNDPPGPGDTRTVPVCIGCPNTTGPLAPTLPKITVDPTRRRTYWFKNSAH